ncbi:MAG: PEP-CTERM sorting domain-containing protein [Verrucomicrobiota bacterium]
MRAQVTFPSLPALVLFAVLLLACLTSLRAQTIDPYYANNYSFTDLGTVPGVPTSYGGVTFKEGDPNTLLIGGSANNTSAQIFSIGVVRGAGNHITGFSGSASFFANAAGMSFGGIDGGLAYGPGGVLFYTSYSDNSIGQIKPGSSGPDRQISLTPLGVGSSVGTLAFVPAGFNGAGRLKIASYSAGIWYDATVSPDGVGTFDILPSGPTVSIGGGPEGILFVAQGNPLFPTQSVLISEYSNGRIVSYEMDANGDPVLGTVRVFLSGLSGAEGSVVDPLTGDFLFSTYGGGSHVLLVQGFTIVPEPRTWALLVAGLAGVMVSRRRSGR